MKGFISVLQKPFRRNSLKRNTSKPSKKQQEEVLVKDFYSAPHKSRAGKKSREGARSALSSSIFGHRLGLSFSICFEKL
jgi:hypothetical protein